MRTGMFHRCTHRLLIQNRPSLKDLAARPSFLAQAQRRKHARRKARPHDSLKPGLGETPLSKALFYQNSMGGTMNQIADGVEDSKIRNVTKIIVDCAPQYVIHRICKMLSYSSLKKHELISTSSFVLNSKPVIYPQKCVYVQKQLISQFCDLPIYQSTYTLGQAIIQLGQ